MNIPEEEKINVSDLNKTNTRLIELNKHDSAIIYNNVDQLLSVVCPEINENTEEVEDYQLTYLTFQAIAHAIINSDERVEAIFYEFLDGKSKEQNTKK